MKNDLTEKEIQIIINIFEEVESTDYLTLEEEILLKKLKKLLTINK